MIFLYIGIPLLIVGLIAYYFYTKNPPVPEPEHELEEAMQSDDICVRYAKNAIVPHKSSIIGVDQSFIVFRNDKLVHRVDNYKVNYNDILPYIQPKERNQDSTELQNNSEDVINCFKLYTGTLRNIDMGFDNPIQFFDHFYKILIKLHIGIRLSTTITNAESFIKNMASFRKLIKKQDYDKFLKSFIGSKIYSSLSSFIKEKEVSYLHISLYKHDIEQRIVKDINEALVNHGIEITSLLLTKFENLDDKRLAHFQRIILEKSRMKILDYTYIDKMNEDIGHHKDIQHIIYDEDSKILIKP